MNLEASSFLQVARELTVMENWAYNDRRDKLRAEFHALMKERGVDVIVCPPYVGSAPLRNKMDYGTYTMLWNMLDQPALVFPTGQFVDPDLDPIDVDYKPTNPMDQQQYDKCKYHMRRNLSPRANKSQMIRRCLLEHRSPCRLSESTCVTRKQLQLLSSLRRSCISRLTRMIQ